MNMARFARLANAGMHANVTKNAPSMMAGHFSFQVNQDEVAKGRFLTAEVAEKIL
jgi:hypothetical protein